MIEGQEVQYSYTSEQAMITKKHIKQCEENVAEIAFTALTELYGTSTQSHSCDDQSGIVKSSYNIIFVNFTLILATPWLFAFIALGKHADTELQKALSCPGFGKLTVY